MTPLLFVGVAVAGGVGAGLRYLLEVALARVAGTRAPWGVLAANLTGAFALGALSAGLTDATGLAVLGTGLLGGYTTFSGVAVTTVLFARERRARAAVLYSTGTFFGALACALAGLGLVTALV